MNIILIEEGEEKQMIHGLKKRNKLGILLSTIITLSILFSNILLVNADPGGTGKFLTINFVELVDDKYHPITSECKVIVTKSSGYEFIFTTDEYKQQMAAGTVKLTAVDDDEWVFTEFVAINGTIQEDPDGDQYVAYFKNIKYGEINAVFEKVVEQYTVTFSSEGSGNYWVEGVENLSEVTVDEGTSIDIIFDPDSGYHVSTIIATYVDEIDHVDYITLDLTNTESYSFIVEANMDIHIIFEVDGIAFVPAYSNNVNVFLSSEVGIEGIDTNQYISFFAGSDLLGKIDLFLETDLVVWEINTNLTTNTGVVVVLRYDDTGLEESDELALRILKYPSLVGDVNNDGVVNGKDDSIVANAVNTNQQPGWYDPFLDVNNDGYVDNEDLFIINQNKGNTINPLDYEDVTAYVDTENNLIYSIPLTGDDFSIFRCR